MMNEKIIFIIDDFFYDWQKSIIDEFIIKKNEVLLYFSNNSEKIENIKYFNFKKIESIQLYGKYDFLPKEFVLNEVLIEELGINHIINLSQNPLGVSVSNQLNFFFLNFLCDQDFYALNNIPLKNFREIEIHIYYKAIDQRIVRLKKSVFSAIRYSSRKNSLFLKFILSDILFSVLSVEDLDQEEIHSEKPKKNKDSFLNFCKFHVSIFIQKINFVFKSIKNGFTYQKWNIGQIKYSELNQTYTQPVFRQWLFDLPSYSSFADPFLILIKSKLFIIFENFNFKTMLGKISIIEYSSDKKAYVSNEVIDIISDNSHFSYPHPLVLKNEIYFLTENSVHKNLFRYKIFPRTHSQDKIQFSITEKVKILGDSNFVDPTPFFHDNLFWLFVGKHDPFTAGSAKLYLYFSNKQDGPYTEHVMSPVVTSMKCARSAGNIFNYNGKLIRPSQNCLYAYGDELNLMEIKELTTTLYKEQFYKTIVADSMYPDGCHHITVCGDIVLVDGLKNKFLFSMLFVKIPFKVKQLFFKLIKYFKKN